MAIRNDDPGARRYFKAEELGLQPVGPPRSPRPWDADDRARPDMVDATVP
ncbi:MAG: hypothetical protein HY652_12050 [Acidobacteria bacterium]|nr:hypothetical protein [Acidobacteriota bacterium]